MGERDVAAGLPPPPSTRASAMGSMFMHGSGSGRRGAAPVLLGAESSSRYGSVFPPPPPTGRGARDGTFMTAVDLGAYSQETSQSTLLLKKKKVLQEVQAELDRKKAEYDARMRKCQEREEEVLTKQERIRESVLRFEKFVRENDLKRARALKKEREESQLRHQKEAEIVRLREELETLLKRKEEYKGLLDRLGVYDAYLESVLEASTDFVEINDILMRHGTLLAANEEMRGVVDDSQTEKELLAQSLTTYTKEITDALLVKQGSVATRQKQAETIKMLNDKLDIECAYRQEAFNARKRTLGEAKMAIANIYLRCLRKGVPAENTKLTFKLLDYIVQRMSDLGLITSAFLTAQRERNRRAKEKAEKAEKDAKEAAKASAGSAASAAPAAPPDVAASAAPAAKRNPKPVVQQAAVHPPPTARAVDESASVAAPARPAPA